MILHEVLQTVKTGIKQSWISCSIDKNAVCFFFIVLFLFLFLFSFHIVIVVLVVAVVVVIVVVVVVVVVVDGDVTRGLT